MDKAPRLKREGGFTLIEMMVALLILSIVLTALVPAFYGELKASAATDYRSTANGLAVAAIEQMRAFPYYEIGYNKSDFSTAGSTALTCVSPTNTYQTGGTAPSWNSAAGLDPVELSSGSALDNTINNLLTSQTISNITYTTTRCVYWVTSSTNQSAAYKETWVGVSWTAAGMNWHVVHTSALYPGGEGLYTSGQDNATPGASQCQNQGTVPSTPTSLTATQDTTSPTTTVDLAWSEPSTNPTSTDPLQYQVDYNSTSAGGPWIPYSTNGLPYQNVDGLTPGVQYWFQVEALACDGTPSAGWAAATQTPATASQSCVLSGFSVSPPSATIDSSDKLSGNPFQFSVNASSACSNVAVQYQPRNTGSTVTDYAPGGTGSLVWNSSASKWAAGTITFHLYNAGTDTGQAQQVTISCNASHC